MSFHWDRTKERANRRKHGVSFAEAARIFEVDTARLEIWDEAHSVGEDRFVAIGPVGNRILVVVFTEPQEEVVRLLSARRATSREIALYMAAMREKS